MPNVDDVRKARRAMMKRRADYEYFFNQLQSPAWIRPLLEDGFLKQPPPPELIEGGRYVRFPFWPESQYLARMAAKAPELVIATVEQIDTDNPRVQENIVDIGLRVSPQLATKLVPKVCRWIRSRNSRWITNKFTEFAKHLALGAERDAAMSVAREILWFDPDPKLDEKKAERAASESLFLGTPEPQAHAEEWDYEQTLTQAIPALEALDPIATLSLLCSVLSRHIVLSHFDSEKQRPYDGSVYWRPAIEFQKRFQTYEDLLVNAVRDAAERYLSGPSSQFEPVEAILIDQNWDIFTRIWLHLLLKFPSRARGRVQEALTDKRLFSGYEFTHEYFHLIQEQFSSISPEAQQQILLWIDAGPDGQVLDAISHDWDGNPVATQEIEKRTKAWKLRKLEAIKDVVDPSHRQLYDTFVAEFGEPSHPDLEVIHGEPQWGPTSPKSQDELFVLDTNSIIAFLRSWQPQNGWTDPSPEGLARAFQAVVKRKPNDLSAVATTFEELDPTYVRALISGLAEAVHEGKQITWEPVLKLCQWVLKQPINITGRKKSDRRFDEGDPDWNWTRQSIARLLRDACERVPAEIPFECRTLVWELVSTLTNDENPSVDYERNRAGSLKPVTLSINTTRGEAMHAVMAYASWIRRQIGQDDQANLDVMPEVAQLLERRLVLDVEPTLTVRSVYAQNLPRLIWIDRQWVTRHLNEIFPGQPEYREYWDVAWSSYVIFSRCYSWVYDVLNGQYDEAIRRLSEGGLPTQEENPNKNLAEHLMILYWIGRLELSDAPLVQFYERASEDLRAHALEFVGRALRNSDNVPTEQLARLKQLWETRLLAITQRASQNSSKELAQYAVWFSSEKFDDEWALEQLIASIKASKGLEREFFVLKRLSQLSAKMPLETLTALDLLVRSAHRRRNYFHGHDEAKTIVENGLRSSDGVAQKKAREIANYLLSLRYSEFRDLAHAKAPA